MWSTVCSQSLKLIINGFFFHFITLDQVFINLKWTCVCLDSLLLSLLEDTLLSHGREEIRCANSLVQRGTQVLILTIITGKADPPNFTLETTRQNSIMTGHDMPFYPGLPRYKIWTADGFLHTNHDCLTLKKKSHDCFITSESSAN